MHIAFLSQGKVRVGISEAQPFGKIRGNFVASHKIRENLGSLDGESYVVCEGNHLGRNLPSYRHILRLSQ